jgi:tryptophan synthase alpha subunit
MNKLDQKLAEIKEKKQISIMAHVVVGYPSLEETVTIVKTMTDAGVSIVELQIPFSDPLADGPTIMKACEQSLARGTKVQDAFYVMKQLSQEVSTPLLFMAYYNTVFSYGVEKFCRDAKAAGASGLIVPDMPLDEEPEEHFFALCKKYNLHTIQVISPSSTDDRLKKNVAVVNGFIYCTARQGTTGAKDSLDPSLDGYLTKMRKFFSLPVAVGFGISKREHIQALKNNADIAIIGSAVIDLIGKTQKKERSVALKRFFTNLMVQ